MPILMSINVAITLRNCYKTLIQSLTDWSNWTEIGPNTAYFGLLDYCTASSSQSVTVFSWNPVATNYNFLLWGNTNNGNPQTDWDASESGTSILANRFSFSNSWHIVGNEYELNNGGLLGDIYCTSTASPAQTTPTVLPIGSWGKMPATAITASLFSTAQAADYVKTTSPTSCV